MKTLESIVSGLKYTSKNLQPDLPLSGLAIDSRKVTQNGLYAAILGTRQDGHDFIPNAIENGARAIVCSSLPSYLVQNVSYIVVENVSSALGILCGNFYDHPDKKLKLIGITGTNGKTTVATLLFELFTLLGNTCGLISTVENRIADTVIKSTHTTPDIINLYHLLAEMVAKNCTHCFMEVSSHALVQQRTAGIEFAGAIFTNLTHDHLDYHQTFEAYRNAKMMLFNQLSSTAFALTNKDDRNGLIMLQNSRATKYTYACHSNADFKAKIIECDFTSTQLHLNDLELWVNLVGEFNVYNLLAVYGAAFILTQGNPDLPVLLTSLPRVNGRFETISGPNNITAIVDYAHTPDALENVIQTINQIRKNSVQLITVVGCGGNRDKSKRPEMGRIAGKFSDKVIFTSDNPRDENPEIIIEEMATGVEGQNYKKILRITDRKEAIRAAGLMAQKGDIILIAGKGHETYQEIHGAKHPFDDKEIITNLFKQLA